MGQLGTNEMASITTVTPIQNIIINFGLGITTAGSILISQYLGAREDKQANIMAAHANAQWYLHLRVPGFVLHLLHPL